MTDGVDDVLAVIDGVDGVPNEISLTRTCEDDDERDGIDDVVFGSDIVIMVK